MKVQYSNNASTTLNAPVEAGHEVMIVASASAFPILTAGDWMYVTVEEEVVKVTNTSGNVFTCEAFDQAHGVGASVQGRITTKVLESSSDADIYDSPGDGPDDGTMRKGEIYSNLIDKQIGVGDLSGNPIDLVAVRFHSSAAGYTVDDLVDYQGGIWKCTLTHSGAWDENNWEPISGGGGGMTWELSSGGTVSAEAGKGYLVSTGSAARQVSLPAGAVGKSVGINDVSDNCSVNSITVVSSGSERIMGLVENFLLDINSSSVTFTYSDASNGWKVTGGNW